jgi:hypothetical protein
MACSNTPLVRKLGIKEGHRVALIEAPAGFLALLKPLPPDADFAGVPGHDHDLDVIVGFFRDRAALADRFPALAACLASAGGLWICWPKKTSGLATDLSDDAVREVGLAGGLVDNKVCAVDATWSAQRFVRRVKDRPAARR